MYIAERQELIRGYARIIYKCDLCGQRIGRISLHKEKIIGFKAAEHFPACPYCKGVKK